MKKLKIIFICLIVISLTSCNVSKQDNVAKVDTEKLTTDVKVDTESNSKKEENKKVEPKGESNAKVEPKKTQTNKYNIVLNEMNLDKNSTFHLSMTYKEALAKIESLGLDPLEQNDQVILAQDKKTLEIILSVGIIKKSNKITDISVDAIPTSLGLKPGDSIKRMEELYGKKYTSHLDKNTNRTIYKYQINNYIFEVESVENNKDKVLKWSILLPK